MVPLRYDDGFRGGIALLVSLPLLLIPFFEAWFARSAADPDLEIVFAAFCGAFALFFLVYLVWTHLVFSRATVEELERVSAAQQRRGASSLSKLIGMRTAEEWSMSAAFIALFVSGAAAILGAREGGLWLPLLVLLTVATAWATVVYAFALRYLRLHAAGERIAFDIDEDPAFSEFLSMAVMVSSVGAMSAGTPRTRAGLTAVRTHTFISFAFNALVVAMAVSLITSLVARGA